MHSTRDPFNLRNKASLATPSAFLLLQNAAAKTTEKALASTKQAVEATKQALQDSDMSFAIPRNVPTLETAQRRFEDNVWNKVTGKEKGLPMYKDKPTSYGYGVGSARGRKSFLKSRKAVGLVALLVLGLLYWFGWSSAAQDGDVETDGKKTWVPFSGRGGGSGSGKKGDALWDKRRDDVRDAFLLSWTAYEEHGWGYDEYHPISRKGRYMAEPNGLGWIIVDALDTLMIMGLKKELKHAREWISTTLDYDKKQDVNTFETTIRMLGGLLSAHYLQETLPGLKSDDAKDEDIFLEKATDLADRLMGAFESPSGIPWASVILQDGKGEASHADGGASSTAEATTLQLELKYLAYLTGESHYWEKAEKVMQVVDNNGAKDGLVPIFIYADKGTFRGNEIRLGSRGDSYYEYLIKQYLQTQKQEPIYLDMWEESLRGVKKHLLTYTKETHLTVLAERPSGIEGHLHPKMDHLVCFMPGTIALAATGGLPLSQAQKLPTWGKQQEEDMQLARELTKTCMGMYRVTPTGLAPEIAHFDLDDPPKMYRTEILQSKTDLPLDVADGEGWKKDFVIKPADAHNLQRPETVESLFYMWRITGDVVYRDWGWDMFRAFANFTQVEGGGGFSSVGDVRAVPPPTRDNMESFWLAETLKYFYLLFSPSDVLPLDQIVLNTEAHPFPRFDASKKRFKTGWARLPRDAKGNIVVASEKEDKKEEKKEKKEGQSVVAES
ncbi:glycoside hydrolase family 47 protein [Dothidotthia symphoricarpi CBS 119687]|uniref:alpha-1,2-Mannosidase n=1 Tax=Dothidotthia symphoricarpi CBS 119687 TaxID=1392245 RepID=A0A6A6ATK4_9PLEO|nr:glycoside hydrolase family 47 protein [Dothidotthia symphoricarpi CBS 119687]KAF2134304.1 glycoside hydrolase family 47 protein [Dothidotthia symphoricarpi CBS 119687]